MSVSLFTTHRPTGFIEPDEITAKKKTIVWQGFTTLQLRPELLHHQLIHSQRMCRTSIQVRMPNSGKLDSSAKDQEEIQVPIHRSSSAATNSQRTSHTVQNKCASLMRPNRLPQ